MMKLKHVNISHVAAIRLPQFCTTPISARKASQSCNACRFSLAINSSRRISESLEILSNSDLGTPYQPHHPAPTLLRVIYLASTIYHRALLTPSTHFSSPINKPAGEELCLCLENTAHDATWNQYPSILLWCLLTGAAATQKGMLEHRLFYFFNYKDWAGSGVWMVGGNERGDGYIWEGQTK